MSGPNPAPASGRGRFSFAAYLPNAVHEGDNPERALSPEERERTFARLDALIDSPGGEETGTNDKRIGVAYDNFGHVAGAAERIGDQLLQLDQTIATMNRKDRVAVLDAIAADVTDLRASLKKALAALSDVRARK